MQMVSMAWNQGQEEEQVVEKLPAGAGRDVGLPKLGFRRESLERICCCISCSPMETNFVFPIPFRNRSHMLWFLLGDLFQIWTALCQFGKETRPRIAMCDDLEVSRFCIEDDMNGNFSA